MKTLLELEDDDCRFIEGEEDRDHMFCGTPKLTYQKDGQSIQSPYCITHHFRCIQPAPPRKSAPFVPWRKSA